MAWGVGVLRLGEMLGGKCLSWRRGLEKLRDRPKRVKSLLEHQPYDPAETPKKHEQQHGQLS